LINNFKRKLTKHSIKNVCNEALISYFYGLGYQSKHIEAFDKGNGTYYTGVRLSYIKEYVLPQFDKEFILERLDDLINKGVLNTLYCGDVNDVIFENKNTEHRQFSLTNVLDYSRNRETDDIKFIKEYLTKLEQKKLNKLQSKAEMTLPKKEAIQAEKQEDVENVENTENTPGTESNIFSFSPLDPF